MSMTDALMDNDDFDGFKHVSTTMKTHVGNMNEQLEQM